METFLAEVAKRLKNNHPNDLDQVTVVFNNRRSGLFLRRQFAAMSDKPFFLPKIIGIDELIADLGELEIVPNEFLLFELYNIHCSIGGDMRKFQSFEEFISFGDMMLADFSEIDLYCVDAKSLFSNLHEIKEIGEWNIETGTLTEFQKRYLEFYKSLYTYYDQLHQKLLSQNKAFGGMAYRYVAENIETLGSKKQFHKIYFVGFNALSTSEDTIIRHYERLGIGELITDGDAYYFNDPDHEAGHFLRKHQRTSNIDCPYPNHFTQSHKDITIVSCPENVLQCKYAGELIAKQIRENPDNPIEKTAIVLGDESLLIPTLNALPPEVKTANITMGYPFQNTAVYSLIVKLFSLHQRRRTDTFYHQDILSVIADIGIGKILGINDLYAKIAHLFTKEHIIYASFDELVDIGQQIHCDLRPISFLFPGETPTPDAFLQMAEQLAQTLYTDNAYKSDTKEQEALACLIEIIHHFQDLQAQYHFVENLNVLLKIFTRIGQRRSVAFYGEPLQGLQILGVLETRNLDFSRIILISANEGTIPSSKTNNTLIPYNLKTHFKIPTFHDKDAVYAYNFYRLLQRADSIHLLYSTEQDGIGKGLPSRFILQVQRELAPSHPNNITLHEQVLSVANKTPDQQPPITYVKDESILHRISEISQIGFSPSVLNLYCDCPLKFYYDRVLNLRKKEAVGEDIESNELGTYIHTVLEHVYGQAKGQNITVEILQDALNNLDQLIDTEMNTMFRHGRSRTGRNHYFAEVAKLQISRFLQSEIKQLEEKKEIKIIGLEEKLSSNITVNINGTSCVATIAGTADRIDECDGITRIIDYKSGSLQSFELNVKINDPTWTEVPGKWLQVMTYTWLYRQKHSDTTENLAGIYPLRYLGAEFAHATWDNQTLITKEHMKQFEKLLAELISDIMNPDIPFSSNFNPQKAPCIYCPFLETCKSSTPQSPTPNDGESMS